MRKEEFMAKLQRVMPRERVWLDEPMSAHTTFCIGGPADFFVVPQDMKEVQGVLSVCDNYDVPCYVCGNGSNLLFPDEGYRGVVLSIGNQMEAVTFSKDGQVSAQAGILLSKLAKLTAKKGLTGLEFAAGIPGTLGGAVAMNAGAYEQEISQCLMNVVTYDVGAGDVRVYSRKEMEFGYRTSLLQKQNLILLSAGFLLQPGDQKACLERIRTLNQKRQEKQPLNYPSAGSAFKRPKGHYAGALIEEARLKGFRVGGAMVSEKHAGFIINYDHATAKDVKDLMSQVSERVYQASGVRLEPEVRLVENQENVWE